MVAVVDKELQELVRSYYGSRSLSFRSADQVVRISRNPAALKKLVALGKYTDTGMLTQNHERDLILRWQDGRDESALVELIFAHSRLINSVAGKYARNFPSLAADIVQEANFGFVQAVQKADRELIAAGTRICSYAAFWMRDRIQELVAGNGHQLVGAPKRAIFSLKRALYQAEEANPGKSRDELLQIACEQINIPLATGVAVIDMLRAAVPIDKTFDDSDDTIGDLIADPRHPDPEDEITHQLTREETMGILRESVGRLDERSRAVITARLKGELLEEIGKRFGVTKERARQIEKKAVFTLREIMTEVLAERRVPSRALDGDPAAEIEEMVSITLAR